MARLRALFAIVGVVLFVYAVQVTGGIGSISVALTAMGWWFPLAFLTTIVAQWLRTVAWCLICDRRYSFRSLARARLIGEALSYVSFAGPLLGDPAKAALLSNEAHGRAAIRTVGRDRYLYAVSSLAFVAVVGSLWFPILVIPAAIILVTPMFASRLKGEIRNSRMYGAIALHTVSNLFMSLEALILLHGLGGGIAVLQSLSVEALSKGLNAVFFFLPMQIGVAEGSHAVLFHLLNVGGSIGVTFGVARRIRSLIWSVIGLMLLGAPSVASSLRMKTRAEALSSPEKQSA
jgi:hypothetical protein